jgi:ribosomal protein S18 acetylase RimI-like enzyme
VVVERHGGGPWSVRRIGKRDVVPLAVASRCAFERNPTFRYLFSDPQLFDQDLDAYLAAQLDGARRAKRSAAAFCLDGGVGCVIWYRQPGRMPMDPVRLRTTGVYERSIELSRAYLAMVPSEAHLLLSVIAVDPADQRRGMGTSLLGAVFGHADRRDVPTMTVTSDEAAASWLVRQGFVPVGTAEGGALAPTQVVLRRDPT